MALNLLVALFLGVLVGLDRHFAGRRGVFAFKVVAALFGFTLGLIWNRFAPVDWSFDSVWVEISAASCAIAWGLGGEDADGTPDDENDGLADVLGMGQAATLGLASCFGAWTYAFVFVMLKVVGYFWRAALDGGSLGTEDAESSSCADELDSDMSESAPGPRASRLQWLAGEPPQSFIAALNAPYEREPAPRPSAMSPEPRQIRVVRNSAKPLDARSAANMRSIARANGTTGRHRIRTEARDPELGRR
jgi:hypothetical protein